MLVLLAGVALTLILMFGSFCSNKSYMQTVVQTRKEGNELSIALQAQQLALLIGDYRLNKNGKSPATYLDLGVPESSVLDQWGHTLHFRYPAANPSDAKEVIVISDGPDGIAGTPDDLTARVPLQF
jgi:hypothetical protein